MEKIRFIIRVFNNETRDIHYIKTKGGIGTKFKNDAFEFDSIQTAKLILSKLNLYAGNIRCDILLKYGEDLWKKE